MGKKRNSKMWLVVLVFLLGMVSSSQGQNVGKIYWTDVNYKIQRANLEIPQGETASTRTDIEDLITTGLTRPTGIALDVAAGKMYWTDTSTHKIQRANLDGSKVEDLVTTGLPMPYGIAVHSCVDDAYEDNDGPSEATVVAAPSSIPDLVAAFEDQDWFKIPVCAGGELIVDVNFTHADGDIDIILFDELLTPPVAVGASTTDNETVNYSSPIYGFVYLLVANRDLTCNSYDLHVQLDDSNCQPVEIIYVDANAPGDVQDGSSWENAYLNLQDALAHANYSDDTKEIRVAGGTYYPDEGFGQTDNDRNSTFQLVNGVAIYGGYAGYGHREPDTRDIEGYETILSGDLDGNDVQGLDPCDLLDHPCRADNSYHVVTGSGTDASAILDGFTITAGNVNVWVNRYGAGMFNDGGSPTVANCTFRENSTLDAGGGMFNDGGSPTVANCTFSANAAYYGGGMLNDASSPTVANCTFSANAAYQEGGGMYNNAGSPTLTNCTFSSNSAYDYGGGMFNYGSSSPTMTNCTFSANSATEGGGMHNWDSSPTLTNCTFSANSANYGGGMHNWYYSSLTLTNCTFSGNSAGWGGGGILNYWYSSAIVTNCILWDGGDEIFNDGNSTATVTYSDIQGGWIGGRGNIDADPCFVDADGFDNTPGTEDDNLRLSVGSPCIDAGDNNSVPAGITTDLDGNTRFYDDHATADTGRGTAPIVDMGAYEYIPDTIYVDDDANGNNDGSSWKHAFIYLQIGLEESTWGDQILVAAGTYKPDVPYDIGN